MPGGPARWFSGWSAPPPGFPVSGRSVAGGGASVHCGGPPIVSVAPTVGSSRWGWAGGAGGVAASPVGRAVSRVWLFDTGVAPGWFPGLADRGVSAGTLACAGSGSGFAPGRLRGDVSVGRTAGPAGWSSCRWDAGSACAGACRWSPGADVLSAAGAWRLGLSVGLWASGRTVLKGRVLMVLVGVAVRDCVGGPSGGTCAGPSVGRFGVLWRGRGPGWACVAAAWRAAGWRPRVDAPGGVWSCAAGLPVGPGAAPICGCALPGGCLGWVPTAAVFVGLGTTALAAGDTRCSKIAVAVWCCGWCRCVACLDARSCRGLCGAPAPDGARRPVVRVVSAACCRFGELTDAWGVEADGLEDVEAVGLCGAPTPDGARARTFVALVAAVARDLCGSLVMVAVLRLEGEELWCQAPLAIMLATAALPYVPGRGGGTCGRWARCANGARLRGRNMPLHVRYAAISLSGTFSVRASLRWKKCPHSLPSAPRTTLIAHLASPTSQPKGNRRRLVRVTTVMR